ncbi:MAG: ShlB/FhaC/HecB family hemolysin secretion/activation protein [Bacteroidota bacterium]
MRAFIYTTISLLLLGLSSCASYKLHYHKHHSDWETAQAATDESPVHRVYLIGDAGNAAAEATPPVLQYLQQELATAPEASSAVFLGDNLYPDGLPPRDHEERELAEHRLRVQTDALQDFAGRTLFIPGNHDWYAYGLDGLDRQRDFLEDELDLDKIWEPKIGCGGPEVIDVHDNLVFIIIDTQWWLANWNRHPLINEGCEATNRTEFLRLFTDAIKGNKEKNVVVVMHHPMETYGPHGGHFPFRDHFFPLRRTVNEDLWVPLPVVGSLLPFFRSNVGTRQDAVHPAFQELKQALLASVQLNGGATFVSGHEHSLQYIEKDGQQYIVSGSASKIAPVGMGQGSQFAYGGRGYACLDLYDDGSLWISFFTVNDEGTEKELLYRHEVQPALQQETEPEPADYALHNSDETIIHRRMLNDDYERGGFGRLILGDHYRSTYSLSTDLPILDLDAYQGGVFPVKRGGGNQTNSIRLEAEDGRQYSMRSLEKDPSATVGYTLSQSRVIRNILEDAFTAAHPLSALPVMDLANAAGVNHTNPEVYYIPVQPALERYNEQFGDAVYLVEERPDDDLWEDHTSFGSPRDIIGTPDLLEKLRKHHKHVLDHASMARARAFDIFLGDWDRHDDQWRWAEHKEDGWTYYRPIPRDRDQAFSNYDGLLLGFARMIVADVRPLAPFVERPNRIHWATHGNRFFDATFLAGIDWATWETEVRLLQNQLTDEAIDHAFVDNWPTEVYDLDAERVAQILKARRDNLLDIVRDLYEFRAREVEIVGTDKKDLFDFTIHENGDVTVSAYDTNNDGDRQGDRPFFERHFLASETKEIIVYGLENDDFFSFHGANRPGPKIRIVGGEGKDELVQTGAVDNRLRHVYYYDHLGKEEKTKWNGARGVRDRRSTNPALSTYSRLSLDKNYNFLSILPSLAFDPDHGLLLGVMGSYTHFGFKKAPFAGRHSFGLQYAFGTSAGQAAYQGEFTNVFGSRGIVIDAFARNSLYAVNFYGFGNETINTEAANGENYHRVRQQSFSFSPQISSRHNAATVFHYGPRYLTIRTQNTPGRFINDISDELAPETFEGQHYLLLNARMDYDNRDSPALPTRGLTLYLEGGYNLTLSEVGDDFPYLRGAMSLTQKLDRNGNIVIANRVGFSHIFTDDFLYFQASTLGGFGPDANFRGFRRERFAGSTSFYLNNDLRLRLINSRNASLPFSLGLLAGFDYGRVWQPEEDSDKWHTGYGGGVWISPFDLMTINVSIFAGDDGRSWGSVSGGFFF